MYPMLISTAVEPVLEWFDLCGPVDTPERPYICTGYIPAGPYTSNFSETKSTLNDIKSNDRLSQMKRENMVTDY